MRLSRSCMFLRSHKQSSALCPAICHAEKAAIGRRVEERSANSEDNEHDGWDVVGLLIAFKVLTSCNLYVSGNQPGLGRGRMSRMGRVMQQVACVVP